MKQHILISLFIWTSLLHADGFTVGTQILTQRGLVAIEQCAVGDHVIAHNNCKLYIHQISHTMISRVDCCIQIVVDGECLCADADQKFYVVNKGTWAKASELEPLDILLCVNGSNVVIQAVELVRQQQKMYSLSVDVSHTFCVGHHGIVAHNMEPASATTAVMTLSTVCPPAAAVVAIGEIVALGVAGVGLYCAHKKLEKNKKIDGCFSQDDVLKQSQNTGCYPSDIPYIRTTTFTPGCTIAVEKPRTTEIIPYEKPEGMNDTCAFPIEVVQGSIVHLHDTNKDDCDEKKQYNGPWYNRTEDWINEHPFGQKIKKSLDRSKGTNQGKRAFEVIKKIEGCDGFNKGDYVVVDAMHKDHLEVFDRFGEWKQVANFDGSMNEKKTKQGQKEGRQPLKWV